MLEEERDDESSGSATRRKERRRDKGGKVGWLGSILNVPVSSRQAGRQAGSGEAGLSVR